MSIKDIFNADESRDAGIEEARQVAQNDLQRQRQEFLENEYSRYRQKYAPIIAMNRDILEDFVTAGLVRSVGLDDSRLKVISTDHVYDFSDAHQTRKSNYAHCTAAVWSRRRSVGKNPTDFEHGIGIKLFNDILSIGEAYLFITNPPSQIDITHSDGGNLLHEKSILEVAIVGYFRKHLSSWK